VALACWQGQPGGFDYGRDIVYHFMHTFAERCSTKFAAHSQHGFHKQEVRADVCGPKKR
jgi:hypothetical protein